VEENEEEEVEEEGN
jgi:hypothetical protein